MNNRLDASAQVLVGITIVSAITILLTFAGSMCQGVGVAVLNLMNHIKPFRLWTQILANSWALFNQDASLGNAVATSISVALNGGLEVVFSSLMDSLILGFCFYLSSQLARQGALKDHVILSMVIGIVSGCILCGGTQLLSRDDVRNTLEMLVQIGLLIAGIIIMLNLRLPKADNVFGNFFRRLLPVIAGAVAVNTLMMYIAIVALVLKGTLVQPLPWVTGGGIVAGLVLVLFCWTDVSVKS